MLNLFYVMFIYEFYKKLIRNHLLLVFIYEDKKYCLFALWFFTKPIITV